MCSRNNTTLLGKYAMTRVSRGANLYQIKQRIYPFKDKFCNTSIQMIYIYTTKIKDKVIREKGVGRFIFAVNSEVGVPLLTANHTRNILYNYFSPYYITKLSIVRTRVSCFLCTHSCFHGCVSVRPAAESGHPL